MKNSIILVRRGKSTQKYIHSPGETVNPTKITRKISNNNTVNSNNCSVVAQDPTLMNQKRLSGRTGKKRLSFDQNTTSSKSDEFSVLSESPTFKMRGSII